MSRTISTATTGPVILNPTNDNPLYITSAGTVTSTGGDGVDGPVGTTWTISNLGLVSTLRAASACRSEAPASSGTSVPFRARTPSCSRGGSVTNNEAARSRELEWPGPAGLGFTSPPPRDRDKWRHHRRERHRRRRGHSRKWRHPHEQLDRSITGNGFGAFITGAAGAITNNGSIAGSDGIALAKGG